MSLLRIDSEFLPVDGERKYQKKTAIWAVFCPATEAGAMKHQE